ncbi:hypothetical protein [Nocardia sp. NPDC050710]
MSTIAATTTVTVTGMTCGCCVKKVRLADRHRTTTGTEPPDERNH